MDWLQLGLSWFGSLIVGAGLWLFLPRGVVLTRTRAGPDEWTIMNDSPLPITIISASEIGVETYDERTGRFEAIELPSGSGDSDCDFRYHGVTLFVDDEVRSISMYDGNLPWRGQVLPPGETLSATVGNNTSLKIRYRRAGWSGLFERRQFEIHGGV